MGLAVVFPGGGARNAAGAGFILGSGISPKDIDLVVACSTSAFLGAFFLSGQARLLEDICINRFTSPRIFSWWRLLLGKPPADLDALVNIACHDLDYRALGRAQTKFVVNTIDLERGETVFHQINQENAREVLRAACAIPNYTPRVTINGRAHVDGGIEFTMPIRAAYEHGHRDILVIANRPSSYKMSSYGALACFAAFPTAPAARRLLARRAKNLEEDLAFARHPPKGVRVQLVEPFHEYPAGRFCNDKEKVRATFNEGFQMGRIYAHDRSRSTVSVPACD